MPSAAHDDPPPAYDSTTFEAIFCANADGHPADCECPDCMPDLYATAGRPCMPPGAPPVPDCDIDDEPTLDMSLDAVELYAAAQAGGT